MKLTKSKLKQIIKEEIMRVISVKKLYLAEMFDTSSATRDDDPEDEFSTGGSPDFTKIAKHIEGEDEKDDDDDMMLEDEKWAQEAAKDIEKKGTEGEFTKYCGGDVTQACIDKAAKGSSTKRKRQAAFAANVNSSDDLVYPKEKKK